jgi:hypothetical protein
LVLNLKIEKDNEKRIPFFYEDGYKDYENKELLENPELLIKKIRENFNESKI